MIIVITYTRVRRSMKFYEIFERRIIVRGKNVTHPIFYMVFDKKENTRTMGYYTLKPLQYTSVSSLRSLT